MAVVESRRIIYPRERSYTHKRTVNTHVSRKETKEFPKSELELLVDDLKVTYSDEENFQGSFNNVHDLISMFDNTTGEISNETISLFRQYANGNKSVWVIDLSTGRVVKKEKQQAGHDILKPFLIYSSEAYPEATIQIMALNEDSARDGAALALTLRSLEDLRQETLETQRGLRLMQPEVDFFLFQSA